MSAPDLLLLGAGEVFTAAGPPLGDGAVAVSGGVIQFVGPQHEAPLPGPATRVVDLAGRLLTPGLVECHTHLVFGGDRAGEYAERAAGIPYREIAQRGGGIATTVRATRAASLESLIEQAHPRLRRLLAQGVTTAEVKSGYGLDHATELRILEAVQALDAAQPIDLVGTYLGAHVVPPEHRDHRARYVREVIEHTLPAVAERGLARFCDVFVEDTAFSLEEAEAILAAGVAHGLRPKVHADQLDEGGGAELAARLGAVSADHLEHISDAGIAALAQAGTVAVLLPGAALFLGQDARAPARRLIEAGVPVALSTDCNPGTCMTEHLQLMLTLGMSRLGMTAHEVLEAVTCHAAAALGLADQVGRIAVGRRADLAVFDVPDHQHLPYHFGPVHTWQVFKAGVEVWRADGWAH
ncbi:MAG: imidazolonepropionase [Myxococcales bacterium]|nr:imidazolonepropionase [Myxococcales bacterium]